MQYGCEHARKRATVNGLIDAEFDAVPVATIFELTGEYDIQRVDRELDHLREIGLLQLTGGFQTHSMDLNARICPTALALHMYVRCQGSRLSPIQYFGLEAPAASQ